MRSRCNQKPARLRPLDPRQRDASPTHRPTAPRRGTAKLQSRPNGTAMELKFKPDSSGLDPATQTNGDARLDGRLLAGHGEGNSRAKISAAFPSCSPCPGAIEIPSIRPRFWRDVLDVVGQGVAVHGAVIDARRTRFRIKPGECVLHPVRVVALWIIFPCMRAAAFGAVDRP